MKNRGSMHKAISLEALPTAENRNPGHKTGVSIILFDCESQI
jgi:hypothetical protein